MSASIASLLSQIERAAPGSVRTAGDLAEAAQGHATGPVIPVRPELAAFLPTAGLPLGKTVAMRGSVTLLLTMLADATQHRGQWAAVVGMPALSPLAARDLGATMGHIALVPRPGREIAEITSALLDGMGLVVIAADPLLKLGHAGQVMARRLATQAQNRDAVLMPVTEKTVWPDADLRLSAVTSRWAGIGQGHGYLAAQELTITSQGRRAAGRPWQGTMVLRNIRHSPYPGAESNLLATSTAAVPWPVRAAG